MHNTNETVTHPRTMRGALGGLAGFIGMSVVAGVLVTVAVTPVLAVSGVTATSAINVFESLPDYLAIDQLSQKSNIYAKTSKGKRVLLASFYVQNRVEVAWEDISPFVKDAAVAGEDPRFREHRGVDLQGTVRGTLLTLSGADPQGGSSITQQYVKNVQVQKCEVIAKTAKRERCVKEAIEITPARKLKEMRLAIGVEKEYSKDDILRQYLNITGFGGRVYGIEAAAKYYFATTAAALTLPQAASLVAIVNSPVKFQLDDPESTTNGVANGYADNKKRRDYILEAMHTHKKITTAEFVAAVATKIEPVITPPSSGCQTAKANAYFCDYVTKKLATAPALGEDDEARWLNFRRGGYQVYTTLDLDLQKAAVATMERNVPKVWSAGDVGGVISSVEVGTGRVLAMTQNKDYTQDPEEKGANYSGINYNTDFAEGGSLGFQPGSTYKVFTLAEWLKEGHTLYERSDTRRKSDWGYFQNRCQGPQRFAFNPGNDGSWENGANYNALESTIKSINTGFVGMAKKLDLCGIRKTAERFKVHRADGDPLDENVSAVLGTAEIAPLTMAVAFAGIANKGVTCTAIAIDAIVDPTGAKVPVPKTTCERSVSADVAAGMAYAMQRVMSYGTAGASNGSTSPHVPMIGKTGTSDKAAATWMSGASTKVATVVGIVSVNGKIPQRSLKFPSGLYVSDVRHTMWPDVMSVANKKYGGAAFPAPPYRVVYAPLVTVPDLRGKSMAQARSVLENAGFGYVDGGPIDSELPVGTVASSDPAGGSRTGRGGVVTVHSSNGVLKVLPKVVGMTEANARSALAAYSVVVKAKDVTKPAEVGIVLSMAPGAGRGAKPGSSVTIVVGRAAPAAAAG